MVKGPISENVVYPFGNYKCCLVSNLAERSCLCSSYECKPLQTVASSKVGSNNNNIQINVLTSNMEGKYFSYSLYLGIMLQDTECEWKKTCLMFFLLPFILLFHCCYRRGYLCENRKIYYKGVRVYSLVISCIAVGAASQWWSNEWMMVYFKLMMAKCSLMIVKS